MTIPEVHLAGEAVAALVDGELAPVAHARALAHLDGCTECRAAVRAQQEAVDLLTGAPDPALPDALVVRLRDIPMTTDLGNADVVFAVDGGDLVWGTPSSLRGLARAAAVTEPAHPVRPARSGPGPAGRQARQPGSGARRQAATTRPPGRPHRMRGVRRVLAGAVAGIALGVFAATAPASTSGVGVAPDHDLIRGVDGGVVDPPAFGEVGVREIRSGVGGDLGVSRFGSADRPAPAQRTAGTSVSRAQQRVLWRGALAGVGGPGVSRGAAMR